MPIADHIKKDSPTNNFATLNQLTTTRASLSNGNLRVNGGSSGQGYLIPTIVLPKTGKWYWEVLVTAVGYETQIGLWKTSYQVTDENANPMGQNSGNSAYIYYAYNGNLYHAGSNESFGQSYTSGDLISNIFDADSLEYTVYKNNDTSNSATKTVTDEQYAPVLQWREINGANDLSINLGQDHLFGGLTRPSGASASGISPDDGIGTFAYTVPSGAKALCTANLPDFTPNVDNDNPEDYFKCVGYVGNGTTGTAGQTVTTGFQPDLIWMKNRDASQSNALVDSVRTRDKVLFSDSSGAEQTSPAGKDVASIISTGFTVGEPDRAGSTNNSGDDIIAWCWKAGGAPGGTNTATSGPMNNSSVSIDNVIQSNYTPSGTIYPKSISINTEQQFSITKYFGIATNNNATIGHGLNGTPDIVIIKSLGQGGTWQVYNSTIGAGRILGLNNSSERTAANDAYFMQTLPNATVVTLGYDGNGNEQNDDTHYIMYCWRSVEHFSAIKSYTGNGSSDGPFIYTGFRPAFLLVRGVYGTGSTSGNHWFIYDNQRPAYNEAYRLLADLGNSEDTSNQPIDLLSNGFKIRNSNYAMNYSGGTYIYMAFAEQPTKFANAR